MRSSRHSNNCLGGPAVNVTCVSILLLDMVHLLALVLFCATESDVIVQASLCSFLSTESACQGEQTTKQRMYAAAAAAAAESTTTKQHHSILTT